MKRSKQILFFYFLIFNCFTLFAQNASATTLLNQDTNTLQAPTPIAQDANAPQAPIPIYKKISQENLKTLTEKEVSSDTGTLNALISDEKDFIDIVREKIEAQLNLDTHTKRKAIFNLLNKYEEKHPLPTLDVLEDGTWKDLEILCGPKTKPDLYLAAKIDRTITEVGRVMLYRKIIQPTDNFEELLKQQTIIKTLIENENLFNQLDSNLKKLAVPESVFLSFWGEDILSSMMQQSKFTLPFEKKIDFLKKITTYVNKDENILMTMSVTDEAFFLLSLGILASTTFTVPADWIAKKYNTTLPFDEKIQKLNNLAPKEINLFSMPGMVAKGAGLLCGSDNKYYQSIVRFFAFCFAAHHAWKMFKWLKEGRQYGALIQNKLAHLAIYIDSLNNMIKIIKQQKDICELMPQISTLDKKIEELRLLNEDFDHLLTLLATSTFKGEYSYFSFWTRMSVAYRLMEQEKEKFDEIMFAIGELDAQMSIARLYKEMKNQRVKFCFPVYQKPAIASQESIYTQELISTQELIYGNTPFININNFWHPCLDTEKVITNSININGKNIVITGPNAAGKSTIMKALVVSIIMAQALGIAPAESMEFTPFSKIDLLHNL